MDPELPEFYYPIPPPTPSAPVPPHDPAWTGLEVVVIIVFTLLAILAASLAAFLLFAIFARAAHWNVAAHPELSLVSVTLLGQTAGFAVGFGFAWAWISNLHAVKFWRAIHWRKLALDTALGAVAGGAVMMIGVQLLSLALPMPSTVPMDRLFTPSTAWILLIYGVAIAPFFEEFFFRGLIYPSLRSTFAEGMTAQELHAWRPLVRWLSVLAILGLLIWYARLRFLAIGPSPAAGVSLGIGLAAAVLFLLAPGLPLAAAGWVLNRLAGWRHPEFLAILITGTLFGLMHASQLGWAWAAVLILIIVGVILTSVRAYTGSLMASWLVHCAYNGTLFAAQFISTRGFQHFSIH